MVFKKNYFFWENLHLVGILRIFLENITCLRHYSHRVKSRSQMKKIEIFLWKVFLLFQPWNVLLFPPRKTQHGSQLQVCWIISPPPHKMMKLWQKNLQHRHPEQNGSKVPIVWWGQLWWGAFYKGKISHFFCRYNFPFDLGAPSPIMGEALRGCGIVWYLFQTCHRWENTLLWIACARRWGGWDGCPSRDCRVFYSKRAKKPFLQKGVFLAKKFSPTSDSRHLKPPASPPGFVYLPRFEACCLPCEQRGPRARFFRNRRCFCANASALVRDGVSHCYPRTHPFFGVSNFGPFLQHRMPRASLGTSMRVGGFFFSPRCNQAWRQALKLTFVYRTMRDSPAVRFDDLPDNGEGTLPQVQTNALYIFFPKPRFPHLYVRDTEMYRNHRPVSNWVCPRNKKRDSIVDQRRLVFAS